MTRFDVSTIGEGGLRLSVPSGRRVQTTDSFDTQVIGAELNVVSTLSNIGWACAWASGVHESPLGDRVRRHLSTNRVDKSLVVTMPDGRTGMYFVEYGSPPLPTSVFFDRSGTSFTALDVDQVDWVGLLDTRVLHLTGLSAALGDGPATLIGHARKSAKERGVPVSFDVNYRSTLWSPETACEVLAPLAESSELLFCSENDAQQVFGIDSPREARIAELKDATNASSVFMSIGADGVLALTNDDAVVHTPSYARNVIDRLGAGDGLAAGVLHGWLDGRTSEASVFGAVVAGLALAQVGETVVASRAEIDRIIDDADVELRR
jgi:2-dehydro-3-deoxygluconokinase